MTSRRSRINPKWPNRGRGGSGLRYVAVGYEQREDSLDPRVIRYPRRWGGIAVEPVCQGCGALAVNEGRRDRRVHCGRERPPTVEAQSGAMILTARPCPTQFGFGSSPDPTRSHPSPRVLLLAHSTLQALPYAHSAEDGARWPYWRGIAPRGAIGRPARSSVRATRSVCMQTIDTAGPPG